MNDVRKRSACALLLLGSWIIAGSVAAQDADDGQPARALRGPNVLLVMTDDQGWGDVYSHGNSKLDTPVMDRLATEGARFDRFYVSPVCAPTRASLLTGRYHLRTGTADVTRGLETMRPEEVTLAEVFRDAGYATGLFGKWHNGAHYPKDPLGQGFDTFFGFTAGHWNNYFDTKLEYNGREVETEGFITDVLTDSALAFIERHREEPFFCYVPYNAPHGPFQVPDRYFDTYAARGLDAKTAAVYAMVENLDDNLGRLLAKLDTLGLAENTIVLFLTDNGPNGDRFNGGMRGRKGSVHEGGVRVPLFVRWPGHILEGRLVRRITAHIDLLPTLAELAGIKAPETLPLDGRSLVPLLRGEGGGPERMLFTHWTSARNDGLARYPGAVRTEHYRLVRTSDVWQLYDMILDPGETQDVAAEHSAIVDSLSAAYEAWFDDVTDTEIVRPPIPIGYDAAPVAELPAPEAYLSGDVRWKGKQGWANDWIVGWADSTDAAGWDLDVVQPGRYAVTLLYTAPEEAVGTRLRAEAGGAHAEAVIREAHDPEPIPSPDRVPRIEVYEKRWAPLELGTLSLDQGMTRLTVRTSGKPSGPFEVKTIRLHRID